MSSLLVFFASGIFEVKLSPKKLGKKMKIEGGLGIRLNEIVFEAVFMNCLKKNLQ